MENENIVLEPERDFIEEITGLIELHRLDGDFAAQLQEYHPFDISQALKGVDKATRVEVFKMLPPALSANIFECYDEDEAIDFVKEMPSAQAVAIIDRMETDEALDLMQYLEDEEEDTTFVNLLSPKKREELKKYWHYTEDQIGSVMSTSYIEIPLSMSVKDAMKKVTAMAGETDYISILFIVDKQKLVGTLKLKQLIVARAVDTIGNVMENRFVSAHPNDDKEVVARLMQEYGESSLPIVDEFGKMVGIVTYDVMMDIISAVHSEDYGRFAGLGAADLEDQSENVFSSVKSRLPWLMILLFLSMISSIILTLFDGIFSGTPGSVLLAANLAIYMPLILDMSGNTGTQSLAVMIRYLVSNQNEIAPAMIKRHLRRELFSGILQGFLLGVLTFLVIYLSEGFQTGFHLDSRTQIFAVVTAFSIFVALSVSNFLGALFPLWMVRLKFDPAVASGPFITTIADLVALVLYYSISLTVLVGLYR